MKHHRPGVRQTEDPVLEPVRLPADHAPRWVFAGRNANLLEEIRTRKAVERRRLRKARRDALRQRLQRLLGRLLFWRKR